MKNKLDHLLYCLGEECGEVQQVAGKAGRFGIYDTKPFTTITNLGCIRLEIHDIIAVWQMLCEETGIDAKLDPVLIADKKTRVEEYMEVSRQQGQLGAKK